MNQEYSLLCRRYAAAVLNVYGKTITFDDCESIRSAEKFLREHRSILSFFELPDLRPDRHVRMIDLLIKNLRLPASLKPLLLLLEGHSHMWLLAETLSALADLFLKRHNIMIFSVESFPFLREGELNVLKDFLHMKTGKEIIYHSSENPRLIAGIRAQGSTLLWEYSIEKKLREARHVIYEQG